MLLETSDTTVAIHHLIFDGTLERYPGLKILAVHGGDTSVRRTNRPRLGRSSRLSRDYKEQPSDYLKKIYFAVVFTYEQLDYR